METIHPDAQSDIPVPKQPKVGPGNRAPSRRDARDITSEELTGGEFRFFPEDPASSINRNYRQPLRPRRMPKILRGMGFAFTRPWVESDTNIDAVALLHNLAHSSVVMTKGERNKEIFSAHLSQYLDFGQFELLGAAYDDGTNADSYEATVARDAPGRVFGNSEGNQSYELEPNQEFSLTIEPRNDSAIPAAADWSTIPQLLCVLQIEHAPNRS